MKYLSVAVLFISARITHGFLDFLLDINWGEVAVMTAVDVAIDSENRPRNRGQRNRGQRIRADCQRIAWSVLQVHQILKNKIAVIRKSSLKINFKFKFQAQRDFEAGDEQERYERWRSVCREALQGFSEDQILYLWQNPRRFHILEQFQRRAMPDLPTPRQIITGERPGILRRWYERFRHRAGTSLLPSGLNYQFDFSQFSFNLRKRF